MASRDARIDAYIAKAQPFARPILKHLREVVHAGCPGVEETIKWGAPAFDYRGPLAVMAAFKAHCRFIFWKAPLMKWMPASGAGQFGQITAIGDLPTERALVKLVTHAAALNESGVRAPRTAKKTVAPVTVPSYMTAALRTNAKARAVFKAFSPSHRREYVEWITGAKTDATRARRLATAIEWLAEGKSRNWKYERR